ncbi:MAG: sigma-70 family RNA polymerase sigma factor [Bacteroidota bacterium]
MSDEPHFAALCRRLRASDREAFAEVFRALREPLLRYVARFTGDAPLAHDLVQDVFVMLWEMRTTLDPEQTLRGLLYRMARNRALNHKRARRTRQRKHDEIRHMAEPTVSPAQRLDADRLRVRLGRWLGDLPERQREALSLTRFEGLSHREAAEAMGVAPRTVNNHIVRALGTLQARLDAFEDETPA